MSDDHDKSVALVERNENKMHPLVKAAMDAGPDPATIEKMMDLQERWERGEARKAFTRAMVLLKSDLPAVLRRDQTVDFTSKRTQERTLYTHTSLASAIDQVIEPLTRHGFSHSWIPMTTERTVSVTCKLQHSEGHSEETTLQSPPDTSGRKGPAQAIASTITLLQRYTLLSLLGIATADMQEPHGPQDDTPEESAAVDVSLNLRAAAKLQEHGRTRAEAEKYLGRPVDKWTKADLDEIRDWLVADPPAPPEPKVATQPLGSSTPIDPRTPEEIAEGYELDPTTKEVVPPTAGGDA